MIQHTSEPSSGLRIVIDFELVFTNLTFNGESESSKFSAAKGDTCVFVVLQPVKAKASERQRMAVLLEVCRLMALMDTLS